jgi:hypothetical protein
MPRTEVDRKRFKEFLDQFIGDVPYQIELAKKLLSQMPDEVAKQFIEELYYNYVYTGPLYKAQHAVFKEDVHYFPNYQSLCKFLNDINKFTNEFNTDALLTIDKKSIAKRMKENLPLCGYLITMEGLEDEPEQPKQTVSRYNQFQ